MEANTAHLSTSVNWIPQSVWEQRLAEAQLEIARLKTLLNQTRPATITAQQFARAHGVSVSTINRACHQAGHRSIDGYHYQESNGRWRIDPAAHLVTSGLTGNRTGRNKKGT